MKKSERLYDMIRYVNSREFFNLHDLMEKYSISKSTALRDIRSLEELGMPIYSEYGKHGRYGMLKNRLLSPIIFTIDEVYALYFAMLTLSAYQSTPFHLRANQLNEKFESCLSSEQIRQIHNMRKVLQFESYQHHHASRFLDKILKSILNESSCIIDYVKHKQTKNITFNFSKYQLSSASGMQQDSRQRRINIEFLDVIELPLWRRGESMDIFCWMS
ncbi:hypothetical protein PAV_2c05790 [Paenibacillus alvei DSM 29]|uniref:helix-turn-helix transcriptional regulator n=1 Tax=Paenibacillus alvei TaxID=44250 RepID=UPI000288A605|nr:hypothetical protein PAV_2c05790 [Paenibacillus alvei DSM 29]